MSTLYNEALNFARRGWCIIPLRADKKPALKIWKRWQQERPNPAQLAEWFVEARGVLGKVVGLGVVCGKVSGGVVVRDYDVMTSYESWARKFPALAARLPTVETPRPGRHIYFQSTFGRLVDLGDGELRGAGYVALPPSAHPSGKSYRWAIALPDGPLPTIADPLRAGFAEGMDALAILQANKSTPRHQTQNLGDVLKLAGVPQNVTQRVGGECYTETQKYRDTETQKYRNPSNEGEWGVFTKIDALIRPTLPQGEGHRNRAIFTLCRLLKADPQWKAAASAELRPIVERWHALALPAIATKPFEETWGDFLTGWQRVKYPAGESPLDKAVKRADAAAAPQAAMRYEQPELRRLAALCRELQRAAGDKPFYLDARTAGRVLGVVPMTAWRWLAVLQGDGLLKLVKPGGRRQASEYVYTGGDDKGQRDPALQGVQP